MLFYLCFFFVFDFTLPCPGAVIKTILSCRMRNPTWILVPKWELCANPHFVVTANLVFAKAELSSKMSCPKQNWFHNAVHCGEMLISELYTECYKLLSLSHYYGVFGASTNDYSLYIKGFLCHLSARVESIFLWSSRKAPSIISKTGVIKRSSLSSLLKFSQNALVFQNFFWFAIGKKKN